ncbi:hypothetical protein PU560_11610 [Georgenia sp. 10Sc9-8]|uniref:Uncharacterized protein n=1 Tax=Georgenia halotolerans TaxID=3028317 RepID=A0ABT5TYN7_9MICO|nr:hypothetical protein [Georgenia halotolerans]
MGARAPEEAAILRRDARQWPWLLVAVLGAVILTGLALLATVVSDGDITPMDLFSDPAEVTGIPWYVGAVSVLVLGVLALAVSVGLDVIGWDSAARRVAEEAAKLLGALAWSLFSAAVVVRHLRATIPDRA